MVWVCVWLAGVLSRASHMHTPAIRAPNMIGATTDNREQNKWRSGCKLQGEVTYKKEDIVGGPQHSAARRGSEQRRATVSLCGEPARPTGARRSHGSQVAQIRSTQLLVCKLVRFGRLGTRGGQKCPNRPFTESRGGARRIDFSFSFYR